MFPENGIFFLLFPTVEATMVLSLEISGEKYESFMCQPSAIRQYIIFFDVDWSLSFHHVFSDAASQKHQRPGLCWAGNAVTSLSLRKQVSVLTFFLHAMSWNKDMNMIR